LEALFGADMPLAVRFFLAFLIVLGLIGATAWAVRRFGAGRLGGAGMRVRQPRLAVVDHASVDSRRRLILVRRDNIEHLVPNFTEGRVKEVARILESSESLIDDLWRLAV
jgi:flagellar biogenesis protein FliO